MLRPGGVLVLHEYFDSATWRLAPRVAAFEAWVLWQRPATFFQSGPVRLVALGEMDGADAAAIRAAFTAAAADRRTRMITPGVMEIVAVRT